MVSGGLERNQCHVEAPVETFLNPLHATNFFLNPLKTSENQRFSDIFRGFGKKPVT